MYNYSNNLSKKKGGVYGGGGTWHAHRGRSQCGWGGPRCTPVCKIKRGCDSTNPARMGPGGMVVGHVACTVWGFSGSPRRGDRNGAKKRWRFAGKKNSTPPTDTLFPIICQKRHGCPKYLKYIKYLIPQKTQYLILQVLDTLFFFLVLFYLFSLCQVLFSQKKRQVLDQVQKKSGYLSKYLTFFFENKYLTDPVRG